MRTSLRLLVVATLLAASSPALSNNGVNRSCAATIGATDGGGLVAFIIRASGSAWWAEMFARARPCG